MSYIMEITNKQKTEIGWIQTFSGIKFYPLAPKQEDINIKDIGWSLSNINRFLGHSTHIWSVAQHSILGSLIIYKKTENKNLAKWFLLHDASEAYLGDIVKPLKILPEFAFYREKESFLTKMILGKFSVINNTNSNIEPSIIKDIDRLLLYIENSQLRKSLHPDSLYVPGNEESIDLGFNDIEKNGHLKQFQDLLNLTQKQVYARYLYEFNRFK